MTKGLIRPASDEARPFGVVAAGVVERIENCVADGSHDLGGVGIPDCVEAGFSHPAGNPIMPSTHERQGTPLNSIDKPTCFPIRIRRWMDGIEQSPLSRQSEASGVGNNPEPPAKVWGTKGCRWYAIPFCIEPERGQRAENFAHPSIKQLWAVLHDDEAGSYLANEAGELCPEAGSFAAQSLTAPARRKVLARETSNDEVDAINSIGSEICAREVGNVAIDGHSGEKAAEVGLAVWVIFAEGHGFHSGPFEAKRVGTAAREKIQDAQLATRIAAKFAYRRSKAAGVFKARGD